MDSLKKKGKSINEGKYDGMLDKIADIVKGAKNFMGVGNELKKNGIKYSFSTSMMPIYHLDKFPIIIVNKRYVDKGDREVGDIAIGLMNESVNEGLSPFKTSVKDGGMKDLIGKYKQHSKSSDTKKRREVYLQLIKVGQKFQFKQHDWKTLGRDDIGRTFYYL